MRILLWIIVLTGISLAQVKNVDSDVVEATVFKDRAMVTRSAEVTLNKGVNELVFSGLTSDIKDESVNISTERGGQLKILDVKVERRFTSEIRKEKIKELQRKIDDLRNEDRIAEDNISLLYSKLEFIQSLKAESVKYANQKILLSTSSTKEWNELLTFIDKNLSEIYKKRREQENKRTLLHREIKTLELTAQQSKSGDERTYKEIIVKIESGADGKFILKPSYIVNSANWYPIYDARVSSSSKELELSYFAMMQQSTGEDWNDVRLTFSTANPLSGKSLPQLDPWYVDINRLPYKRTSDDDIYADNQRSNVSYDQNWGLQKGFGAIAGYLTDRETGEPLIGANVILDNTSLGSSADINGRFYIANVPASDYTLRAAFIGYNKYSMRLNVPEKHVANLNIALDAANVEMEEIVVSADKPLVRRDVTSSTVALQRGVGLELPEYSDISSKSLSTTFELKTVNSIPSDNTGHKVTISVSRMPIEFEYTSIPKILPKVYIKGKVFNQNEYPLLEGEINIFMDNDFVNRTHIETVVPNDSLELALGIDESIQAEKILKKRFVDSKGLFGGTRRITYEFEINVTNNRKTKEKILVYDQLPVALNEEIKVEVITPLENELIVNDDKEIKWELELEPGEKKSIPLKFSIEASNDVNIYGLE